MRVFILIIILFANTVSAQNSLPDCSGVDASRWSKCSGTLLTFPDVVKFVDEFHDGEHHGQRAFNFVDGRPIQEGVWEIDKIVSAKLITENMVSLPSTKSPSVAPVASIKELTNIPPCNGLGLGQSYHCFGTYKFSNGASYVGEFGRGVNLSHGYLHGKGTLTFTNGDKYDGEFREGNITGQGIFYSLADRQWKGDKYVGEFREGKFHGQGAYTFANGSPPLEGIWDNHTFVSAQRIPENIAGRTPSSPPKSGALERNNIGHFPGTMHDRYSFVREPSTQEPIVDKTPAKSPSVVTAPRQAAPTRASLALSVSTSQPDSEGVVTLTITTNSDTASLKINGDEAGEKEDGRYAIKKFVQLGNNVFDVVATDRFGNTQRQSVSVTRRAADSTVRFAALNPTAVRVRLATNAVAIIIGIQDYSRVPKAEFANNDARVFYDYAIRGLGVRPENIKILLDQEANDIDILGAFKNWLPLKTRKGQTDVYVFYSGHGLPSDDGANLYVLPHGVDRQFLDRTAIKQSELIASLQAVSPKSVTMFMDACYSGQIRTGETLLASARPIAIQPKASSFPANFNVISASAPDQLASSSPELKHGVFSYFLMKGMEGEADENKDGNITMVEMQTYLKEYVGKKAMSLNRTQVPQLIGDQSRVLVSR